MSAEQDVLFAIATLIAWCIGLIWAWSDVRDERREAYEGACCT